MTHKLMRPLHLRASDFNDDSQMEKQIGMQILCLSFPCVYIITSCQGNYSLLVQKTDYAVKCQLGHLQQVKLN